MPTVISLLYCLAIVSSDNPEAQHKSICDDREIHTADRLINGTVRLYRDSHYWELVGVPEPTTVTGPYKIWYEHLAPVERSHSTFTCLVGADRGKFYRFNGDKWWRWDANGVNEVNGLPWDGFDGTDGKGILAAYHDGNASGIGKPLMVGFGPIKVFYFSTELPFWFVIDPPGKAGAIGGFYRENIPGDVDAVFSWPAEDKNDKYILFLFRRGKYCKRSWVPKEGKNCKTDEEWISNKVIFGCEGVGQPPPGSGAPPPAGTGPQESHPPDSGVTEPPGGGGEADANATTPKVETKIKSSAVGLNSEKYFVPLLIAIYFKIRFY